MIHRAPSFHAHILVVYFDGTEQGGKCGAGAFLLTDHGRHFELSLGCGNGTNTRAKLLACWGALRLAMSKEYPSLQLAGDYSVIINWLKGKH